MENNDNLKLLLQSEYQETEMLGNFTTDSIKFSGQYFNPP